MAVDALARALAAGKVPVSAYEMAVKAGYTGTEEQFAEDMGNSGTNATNAADSAAAAAASATTAANAAGNLAPAYSASATYAVGDHVLYDGGYYVCNTAITTAEAWTAAHWTAAKVGPEITDLKTQIKNNATIGEIIPGKYVNTQGNLAGDNAYDCCDYVDVSAFISVRFSVSMTASGRGLAFYNDAQSPVLIINGNNCAEYGDYTASSVPQTVNLTVPDNAKYLRFSRRNSYDVTTTGFAVQGVDFSGIVTDIKEFRSIDFDNFVEINGKDEVTIQNAEFLDTIYTNAFDGNYTDGYGISGSGSGVVPASGFTLSKNSARYNLAIVKIKPNTKYRIIARQESNLSMFRYVTATKLISSGETFDGSRGYTVSSGLTNKVNYKFTSGENDNYLYIYGQNSEIETRPFVQVAEGWDTGEVDQYNVYHGVPNDKLVIEGLGGGIKITPVSGTRFNVLVLDEASGEWITHTFLKQHYEDTVSYGSGQSKTVVTQDVWRAEDINNENGDNLMQGNTNFIQKVNEEGHAGHVGAGHGCCVRVWDVFFADGKPFVPETLDVVLECSCFRFTEKVNHYLMDGTATTSSSHAIPVLDENGDPIIVSTEYLDAEWTINNRMTMRNRLDIVRDNTQFGQCFAGMMACYYPYFDHIMVNNPEFIYNELSGTGDNITVTNIGGTSTVIPQNSSKAYTADEVIMYGDKYRCKTRIVDNNPARHDKLNLQSAALPPNADSRIKFYFMPCLCSDTSGANAETFHTGDILDVMIYKELDVSK